MKRIHLFEFTDMPWYPQVFRRIQTDYLQFVATFNPGYKNLVPLIRKAMQQAKTSEIVDLCSGGTGPWMRLQEEFKRAGMHVTIKLTDKYPNPDAIQKWSETSLPGIEYLAESVDATKVPSNLKGMRTLFEGFHHFQPGQAKGILADAVEKRVAIGIFEASLKPPLGIFFLLISPLLTVIAYILMTPFIRPLSWWRLLWTYLIPIVPLTTSWDGIVSFLRVYSFEELKGLTDSLQKKAYTWEIGRASTGTPIFEFTYLLGYPTE
jgi:hypothetical protein